MVTLVESDIPESVALSNLELVHIRFALRDRIRMIEKITSVHCVHKNERIALLNIIIDKTYAMQGSFQK